MSSKFSSAFVVTLLLSHAVLAPLTVIAQEQDASPQQVQEKNNSSLNESVSKNSSETSGDTSQDSVAQESNQTVTENIDMSEVPDESVDSELVSGDVSASSETANETTSKAVSGDWEYVDKGTYCVIISYSGTEEDWVVPNEINGKPTKITKDTFKNLGINIKSVTIQAGRFGKVGVEGSSLAYLLSGRNSLKSVDLSGLDTSNVTDMSYMFSGCPNLTSLNISNFDTSNVTNMSNMFSNCSSLPNLDVSNFDTSKVTNMSTMFGYCNSLTSLNVSNFDTSNVTDMSHMFSQVSNITDLDVSNFDMRNVISMSYMFQGMTMLQTINLSSFNTTPKVRDVSYMFSYCVSLTNLDISNFDTSNVENMECMFSNCNKIKKLDLRNFDTSKVTSMSHMFAWCHSLIELNVSNFNTSKVKKMSNMFADTYSLQVIDLSSFEISASVSNYSMFWLKTKDYRPIVKPLTVIAKDPFFFNYQYDTDKRTVNSILLNANGGTFSDGSVKKNYFTSCAIRPEETSLDKLEEFKQNNLPTKTGFRFNGYTTTTDTSQATSVLDLIGTVYDAQWKARTISLEVPTAISFGTHKLSRGTNYYSVDSVEGKQLSVTDDRGVGSKWQLTAKLQAPLTNNGKTLPNSLVYKTDAGEETITENVSQVIAMHTTSTDSEKTTISDGWTNDQGLMLKLEEGKAYAGEYSGTIEWTLNDTP